MPFNLLEESTIRTDLVVVRQEKIAVHLVDENFKQNVRVVPVRACDRVMQSCQSLCIRFILCVNDKHNGTAIAKDHLLVHELSTVDQVLYVKSAATLPASQFLPPCHRSRSFCCTFEIIISRKIPNLKLYKRIIRNVLNVETIRAFQE